MKKNNHIKKIFKIIVSFVAGAAIFGSLTYVAATSVPSNEISYTNSKNANVTTLYQAANDLYTRSTNLDTSRPFECYNGVCGTLQYVYWVDNYSGTQYGTSSAPSGSGLAGTFNSRKQLEQAIGSSTFANRSFYVRTSKLNGVVAGHEVCIYNPANQKEFCLKPGMLGGVTGTSDTNYGLMIKNLLRDAMSEGLGTTISDASCGYEAERAWCYFGSMFCNIWNWGDFYCYGDGYYCDVWGNQGKAFCTPW